MTDVRGPIGDHPLDDLAAYALDALDDAERQTVDDHLTRCDVCRAELAEHHETLAALTPDEAPPPAVWQRIAADIGALDLADPHTAGPAPSPRVVSVAPEPAQPTSSGRTDEAAPAEQPAPQADDGGAPVPSLAEARARARRPARTRWLAAAAGLTAAATAGGVFGFVLGGSGDDRADIGTLAQQASQDPNGVLATLADTGGQPVARVVADEDGAFILLEGLQDLPEGRAYQLWSLDGPQPVSLGMLGREGTNTVAFRLPPTISQLAISVEPTSGETAPSTELQASGVVRRS